MMFHRSDLGDPRAASISGRLRNIELPTEFGSVIPSVPRLLLNKHQAVVLGRTAGYER